MLFLRECFLLVFFKRFFFGGGGVICLLNGLSLCQNEKSHSFVKGNKKNPTCAVHEVNQKKFKNCIDYSTQFIFNT